MADESQDLVLSQPTQFQQDRATHSPHIHVIDITLEYHGSRLLEAADVHWIPNRIYGLIGNNGSGKSSLFRAIAERRLMNFPAYLSVSYVAQQDEEEYGEETALEYVMAVLQETKKELEEREEELLQHEEFESDEIQAQLAELYEELDEIEAQGKVRAVNALKEVGFRKSLANQSMSKLSGGYRVKASLARAFIQRADVLLLDEPTNHLDMQSIIWLEKFVRDYAEHATVVIVSHDVCFLNNVCTDTMVLHKLKFSYHPSNYEGFMEYVRRTKLNHERQYELQEEKRKHMQETIRKIKVHAQSHKSGDRAMNKGMIASREKRLFHLGAPKTAKGFRWKLTYMSQRPVIQATEAPKPVHIRFKPLLDPLPKDIVIRGHHVCIQVGDRKILQDCDFTFQRKARIGLVGVNGSGKTSFLKILAGESTPTSGRVEVEHNARIGYFHQHPIDALPSDLTAVQHLCQKYRLDSEETARNHCGLFGLTGKSTLRPIRVLSGGEKARIALADIMYDRPHILLMDEPSNHLDLQTIEALKKALSLYDGAIIMASHDRSLISAVCTELFEVYDEKLVAHESVQDYLKNVQNRQSQKKKPAIGPVRNRRYRRGASPTQKK